MENTGVSKKENKLIGQQCIKSSLLDTNLFGAL